MDFVYRFPAVRGVQANRSYFVSMVPLRMISRLFPSEDEYVLPEFRAQRKLNVSRIPEIAEYITDNRNDYVFSALSASIDGAFSFLPSSESPDLGILEVSMDARFLINDGQHRKAAILQAIQDDETLLDETISVVFFEDKGLARSQQIFTDLNKHAVKTSNSLAECYDSRDFLSIVTRDIVSSIPFYNKYTDKETDNLGKYSAKLFTLNMFYKSNQIIIRGCKDKARCRDFLFNFWTAVKDNILLWQELETHEISKKDLRELYIVTQGVVIKAFGYIGNYYFNESDKNYVDALKGFRTIDWGRGADCWYLRTIKASGRINSSESAAVLTSNYIKSVLGIPLNDKEKKQENDLIKTNKKVKRG